MSVMQAEIGHAADEELVDAARSGHREAFDALANRHFGMVYAIGLARLGNRDQAEDLAQEVFLRAFLLLDQLDSRALFSHWLSRIARNLAVDWQRRGETASRLLPMLPLDEIPREVGDEKAANPRHAAENAEQSAALREALGKISPEARELVLLHYMEGLSQHEIARRMGMDRSTVTRQIGRSLATMRLAMETALRDMARGLIARPSAKARTAALGAAVIALPAATRRSLAALAAQSLQSGASASSAKVAGAAAGSLPPFIKTSFSLLKTGGALMGYGKAAAGVAIVAALAGGGFYYLNQDGEAPPSKPAIVGEAIASTDPAVFKMALPTGKRIIMRTESVTDSTYELPKDLLAQGKAQKGGKGGEMPSGSKLHVIEDTAITARDEQPDGGRAVEFETVGMLMEMNMGDLKEAGAAGTAQSGIDSGAAGVSKLDVSKGIGRKVVGHLNSKDEIVSVEGLEAFFDALKSNMPASNPMNGIMAAANNEDAWKKKYQSLFAPINYSETPVKIGDTWKSRDIGGSEVISENIDETCRFTGWKMLYGHRVAEIQFEHDPAVKPVGIPSLLANAKYDSIAQSGTILFDTALGIIAQLSSKTKMDMSMDIPVPDKTGQKMKIRTNSSTWCFPVEEDGSGGVIAVYRWKIGGRNK